MGVGGAETSTAIQKPHMDFNFDLLHSGGHRLTSAAPKLISALLAGAGLPGSAAAADIATAEVGEVVYYGINRRQRMVLPRSTLVCVLPPGIPLLHEREMPRDAPMVVCNATTEGNLEIQGSVMGVSLENSRTAQSSNSSCCRRYNPPIPRASLQSIPGGSANC